MGGVEEERMRAIGLMIVGFSFGFEWEREEISCFVVLSIRSVLRSRSFVFLFEVESIAVPRALIMHPLSHFFPVFGHCVQERARETGR